MDSDISRGRKFFKDVDSAGKYRFVLPSFPFFLLEALIEIQSTSYLWKKLKVENPSAKKESRKTEGTQVSDTTVSPMNRQLLILVFCKRKIALICLAAAKSLQSCPTLCDPIDGSPPGSPISGILKARTLEWVAISFSNAWKWKVKVKSLSCVQLFVTPWTAAHQVPPSMGFSRQEYLSHCNFRSLSLETKYNP